MMVTQNHRNLACLQQADLSLPAALSCLFATNILPAANLTHVLKLVSSTFAPNMKGLGEKGS